MYSSIPVNDRTTTPPPSNTALIRIADLPPELCSSFVGEAASLRSGFSTTAGCAPTARRLGAVRAVVAGPGPRFSPKPQRARRASSKPAWDLAPRSPLAARPPCHDVVRTPYSSNPLCMSSEFGVRQRLLGSVASWSRGFRVADADMTLPIKSRTPRPVCSEGQPRSGSQAPGKVSRGVHGKIRQRRDSGRRVTTGSRKLSRSSHPRSPMSYRAAHWIRRPVEPRKHNPQRATGDKRVIWNGSLGASSAPPKLRIGRVSSVTLQRCFSTGVGRCVSEMGAAQQQSPRNLDLVSGT